MSQARGSLDKVALKDVIRKRWESELDTGRLSNREAREQLNSHASNIKNILNNYDYEIFCMPNIITNTKGMSKSELNEYLKHIEALAIGYSSVFNNDLATLLLIGVTCKSRSVSSIARYYDSLSFDINKRISYYGKLLDKNSEFMSRINYEIKVTESGFLRLFRKKKISRLKEKAGARHIRIKKIEKKLSGYNSIKARMFRK